MDFALEAIGAPDLAVAAAGSGRRAAEIDGDGLAGEGSPTVDRTGQ